MKHGAITFAFLLATGAAGGLAFTGCSSEPPAPAAPPADAGTEAATDTGPLPDSRPPPVDMGPLRCDQPVGADYACPDATKKAGETVCTDEALFELLDACFGGDGSKCGAWQKKYPACNTCTLTKWLVRAEDGRGYVDIGACMQGIDSTSPCGKASACWFDCRETVCGECADDERAQCWSRARRSTDPKGSCYEKAYKQLNECSKDPKFAPCQNTLQLYRGACRDGGDWTLADKEKPTPDAGVDAPVDTGPVDTGVLDTGVVDTGPEAAADTGIDAPVDAPVDAPADGSSD